MTTSQEIDQQFASGDLDRRLKELELFVGKMRDAGMDTLTESGYLQAGLNLPRLDKNGIQIATSGSDTEAIFFVYRLVPDPTTETTAGILQGFANPTGFAGSPWSQMQLKSLAGTATADLRVTTEALGNDSATVQMNAIADTTTSYVKLIAGQGVADGTVEIGNAVLQVGYFTGAPTGWTGSLGDGSIWYDTDDDILYARIGGASVPQNGTGSELTIATGAITVTSSYHRIDTEGDAATDDLATINGGTMGQYLTLRADNGARDVVVKDGTGNLQLEGDFTMNNVQDTITLIYDSNLTAWLEVARSNNGA